MAVEELAKATNLLQDKLQVIPQMLGCMFSCC